MDNVPVYIAFLFIITTVIALCGLLLIIRRSDSEATCRKALPVALLSGAWLVVQAILARNHIYSAHMEALPPRIMVMGILPALLVIVMLFITKGGRRFMDSLSLSGITALNIIRIPVEIVLLLLFIHKAVPQVMTFEGHNFDILSGITAPFVAYLYSKRKLGRKALLVWNIICLGLLLNIVANALLSAPTPLQREAFDQPNIAILYFPYVWLPVFVVPVVLFGHLVAIRRLVKGK